MGIDITTLALAKEYTNRMVGSGGTGGGVNGKDGITPHIGDNGNWFIGTVDTGISAQGPAGENGVTPHIGTNGNWYIGSVNTGVSAKGARGDNGLDGNGIKSAILNSDYTLTLTFDDGTTYTTPSIRGATGDAGSAGKNGTDGKDGSDGVGIASIKQTTTSTADGGNNVFTVTLTNGTTATFIVKNGSKGSTGKDGSNGVDGGHYTPVVTQPTTDTMQISFAPSKSDMPAVNPVTVNLPVSENSGQNVDLTGYATEQWVLTELAKRGQLKPEFVNSIEECTDESKLYVLPEGYIYAYLLAEVTIPGGAGYTNRADPASPDWCINSRLGSSGVSEEASGSVVTNYIPCKKDDLIRVEGLNIGYLASNANARMHYYDSNKGLLGTIFPFTNSGAFVAHDLSGYDAYKWDYKVGSTGDGSTYESFADSISFVRFCGKMETDAANVVITVNEEIKTSEPTTALEYMWANTGHAFIQADDGTSIPGYWADHLSSKIARIKELQKLGGKDCFTFVSIADLHAEQNLGKLSGLLARKIMDECNIKYALVLGDIATRHSVATEADMDKSLELGFSILKPILSDALLAQGNHDGAYSTSYGQNYSRGKIYETFSRKVGLVGDVHFCDDGYGYYIDDTANRVRYVILNPHNQLGRTDVNYFNTYRFGQSQFDLMAEALTTMPKDDWGVVFASHIPPVTEVDRHGDGVIESDMTNNIPEQGLLRNMITAFNVRSESFSGSYDAPGTWDYVNLADVDFSNAKGNFIGYFAGHLHADCLFSGGIYNFPIVTSRCDSANENVFSNNGTDVDEVLKDERIKGTTTEQSFDVFTVNKTERKIYATKIGAGSDREINY